MPPEKYLDRALHDTLSRVLSPDSPATTSPDCATQPGSLGERFLQSAFNTEERATRFYGDQVLDRLNPAMAAFVRRMEMAFISTADANGECDATLRAGQPGFIKVIDDRHIAYPEYRGNGVMASLGNIMENPHVGMLLLDFTRDLIGLHVNGRASIVEDAEFAEDDAKAERWVVVEIEEAYIHCRKHIPRMVAVDRARDWGTDDVKRKGGDYFGVKASRS